MKKSVFLVLVFLLIFLAGCGKDNIQAATVADTAQDETVEVETEEKIIQEPGKTAGEMIDVLKDSAEVKQEAKIGTFYGEMEVTSTGKDALKEKTKALFEKEFFTLNVEADRQQGPRYH